MARLMRPRAFVPVLPILILFLASCSDDPSRSGSVTVRDSAGVVLVVNETKPEDLARWRTEPLVSIGELDGPEEYSFGEIADVEVSDGGDLLVLDRQAQRATVYDGDGQFKFRFGGPGEGPGELSPYLMNVRQGPADSLSVLDYWQMRLNVYEPDGRPSRTIPLLIDRYGPFQFNWLSDGHLLLRWATYKLDAEGRFTPWDVLLLSNEGQTEFDTVLALDYRPPEVGGMDRLLRPMFTNTAFYDLLSDGRIVWSDLEGSELSIHEPSGRLERLVRNRAWERRATTTADRGALEAVYRAGADDPVAPIPDNILFPDSIPVYSALVGNPDGGFWLQRFGPLEEIDPTALFEPGFVSWLGGSVWEVYDRDGRWVATVDLPPRFRITRLQDSTVVGIKRDDLDVERVMVLKVVR